jgi:palmitoyltransferase
MGGLVLGWKAIDRADGGGSLRLEIGILAGIGLILAMITTVSSPSTTKADIQALGIATASLVTKGHLTVDRERHRSQARAKAAIAHLRDKGQVITPDMLANLERWSQRHYYYVPHESGQGKIVELELGDGPYDLGDGANWTVIMGGGWGWLLPWQAVRRGMRDEIYNWPLSAAALASLRSSQHS